MLTDGANQFSFRKKGELFKRLLYQYNFFSGDEPLTLPEGMPGLCHEST
jgi:hypothetical protein